MSNPHRTAFAIGDAGGIAPELSARVLADRDANGDDLIVCDTNFPADSIAAETRAGELLRMENLTAAEAINAILSVMPLDTFVDDFAGRMEVVGSPDEIPAVQQEVAAEIAASGESRHMMPVERFAFYDLAKGAYAIIQSGERRFYGCFMLRKGVIPPEG